MRYHRGTHGYSCGVDLHARTMYLSLIDHQIKQSRHYAGRQEPPG
jgi:hypothetical protein